MIRPSTVVFALEMILSILFPLPGLDHSLVTNVSLYASNANIMKLRGHIGTIIYGLSGQRLQPMS